VIKHNFTVRLSPCKITHSKTGIFIREVTGDPDKKTPQERGVIKLGSLK